MGTYNMFSDLPPIEDCEYTAPEWQSHSQNPYPRTQTVAGIEQVHSQSHRRQYFGLPAIVPMEHSEHPPYSPEQWSQGHMKLLPSFSSCGLPVRCEGTSPWASVSIPRRSSPTSSYSDEQLSSDDGSSTWSPILQRSQSPPLIFSDSWKAAEGHHAMSTEFLSSHGQPLPVSHCHTSNLGIALQDVQQYPDECSDENFNALTEVDIKPPYAYMISNVPSRTSTIDDSDLKGITKVMRDEDEDMKDESSSDYDNANDSASDYSPKAKHTTTAHRSPRSNRNTAKNNRKAPTRPRRPSKSTPKSPSKVSKRQPKQNISSDTIVVGASNKAMCPHCSHIEHNRSALAKHITNTHTRPFTCTFRIYGCTSRFGSKNEWKRHVFSQHLRLGFWRCTLGQCYPQQRSDADGGVDEDEELIFNDFNRKDLFTQHLRRMHKVDASASAADKASYNAMLLKLPKECFNEIRTPPPRSVCGYCTTEGGKEVVFEGQGAWESRMEHVGRHLESGHGDEREWIEDGGLRDWMAEEGLVDTDVNGRHRLTINQYGGRGDKP